MSGEGVNSVSWQQWMVLSGLLLLMRCAVAKANVRAPAPRLPCEDWCPTVVPDCLSGEQVQVLRVRACNSGSHVCTPICERASAPSLAGARLLPVDLHVPPAYLLIVMIQADHAMCAVTAPTSVTLTSTMWAGYGAAAAGGTA